MARSKESPRVATLPMKCNDWRAFVGILDDPEVWEAT